MTARCRRILTAGGAVLVAAVLVLAWPVLAFADGLDDPAAPVKTTDTLASVHLSVVIVSGLLGIVLPVLVSFITKSHSPHKGIVLAVLSAFSAMLVNGTLGDGSAVLSQQSVFAFGAVIVAAIGAYQIGWKPYGITSSPVTKTTGDQVTVVPGKLAAGGII